jgi:hypothetical protein
VFPHPQCKNIGLTITLADITKEEFRVLGLIETDQQDYAQRMRSSAFH